MLEKVNGGYKVKKEHGSGYFSKKPQSKKKAQAQLRAIEAHKHGHAKYSRREDGSYGMEC